MNFLSATVEVNSDVTYLAGKNFKIRCDENTRQRLLKSTSSQVDLGIRPSDLSFDPNGHSEDAIDVDVVVSEYIGAQSVLIGDCGGEKVMVELKSDTPVSLGEKLRFRIDLSELHLFDLGNGEAIR